MTDPNRRPIFIVGPSRSGTTLLRAILCHHPDLHITGETHFFDDLRAEFAGQNGQALGPEDRKKAEDYFLALSHRPYGHQGRPDEGWMPRVDLQAKVAELGGAIDHYFEAYCRLDGERLGKSRWGEKTPRHVFRIDDLLRSFPDAQVVCMVRDPRAVVASYRDWKSQGGFDFDKDPTHKDALEEEHQRTRASYHLLIASMLWRSTVNAAVEGIRKHGEDRVRLLRYEDLVLNPQETIAQVTSWLGIETHPKMFEVPMVNSSFARYDSQGGISKAPVEGWRKRLSPKEVGAIQAACKKPMQAAHYDRDEVRGWRLYYAWQWITAPFAALRAALANKDRIDSLPSYVWKRLRLALGSGR